MSNGLNTLKTKYLKLNRNVRRAIWLFVLFLSLFQLYVLWVEINKEQYCFSKFGNEWYYGKPNKAIGFWNERVRYADTISKCMMYGEMWICSEQSFKIQSNYLPTVEEMIKEQNRDFLLCYTGDWKNATES